MRRKLSLLAVLTCIIGLQSQAAARAATTPSGPPTSGPETICHYTDGSPITATCARLREAAEAHLKAAAAHARPTSGGVSPATGYASCQGTIGTVAAATDGVLDSQLDLIYPGGNGNICYFFWGSTEQNYFDFDDNWQASIRVWVCGTFKQQIWNNGDLAYGTAGPPAEVSSATWYYGSCGPQADNYNSYAIVDYVKHWFPYVHF